MERQQRIVGHLRVTKAWVNAFGIGRVLGFHYNTVAKICARLVKDGVLEQELREASDGKQSVHYHAR